MEDAAWVDLPDGEPGGDAHWAGVLQRWEALLEVLQERIVRGDLAMVRSYMKRAGGRGPDPRF